MTERTIKIRDYYTDEEKEYKWEERPYDKCSELFVLAKSERQAEAVIKQLQQGDELEHSDYLASELTTLGERMDGKRWFIGVCGSECWCHNQEEFNKK